MHYSMHKPLALPPFPFFPITEGSLVDIYEHGVILKVVGAAGRKADRIFFSNKLHSELLQPCGGSHRDEPQMSLHKSRLSQCNF